MNLALQAKALGACFVVRKDGKRTDVIVHRHHGEHFVARRPPNDEILAKAGTLEEMVTELEGKV